jgi:hypothetical protein
MKKTPEQRAATRRWVVRNREHVRAIARQRYANMTPDERAAHAAKHKAWTQKNRDHINTEKRRRYQEDSTTVRSQKLKCAYGITLVEYSQLLAAQRGVCAICGEPPTDVRLHVDHNHNKQKGESGFIRGLLCSRCNLTLGKVEDSVDLLHRLADYLVKHGR